MTYSRIYVLFCQEENQKVLEFSKTTQDINVPRNPDSASAPEVSPTAKILSIAF